MITFGKVVKSLDNFGDRQLAALRDTCDKILADRQQGDVEPARLYTEDEYKIAIKKAQSEYPLVMHIDPANQPDLDLATMNGYVRPLLNMEIDINGIYRGDLVLLMVAKVIGGMSKVGQITVTDQPVEMGAYISYEKAQSAISEVASQAFWDGAAHAVDVIQEIEIAAKKVDYPAAMIQAASSCSNGPKTRSTVQAALTTFVGAIQNLKIERERIEQSTFISFSALDNAIKFWSELRTQAEAYLTAPDRQTDAEQEKLRKLVAQHSNIIANVSSEIADLRRRGRVADEINAYIGELAAAYPDTERGKGYTIGESILKDLRKTPSSVRTQKQKDAILQLESYYTGENLDRSRLGTYISRYRKLHIERNEAIDLKQLLL